MGGAAPRTGYKVRITGLPEGMRWSELKDFVRKAGDVTYADVRGDEGCVVRVISRHLRFSTVFRCCVSSICCISLPFFFVSCFVVSRLSPFRHFALAEPFLPAIDLSPVSRAVHELTPPSLFYCCFWWGHGERLRKRRAGPSDQLFPSIPHLEVKPVVSSATTSARKRRVTNLVVGFSTVESDSPPTPSTCDKSTSIFFRQTQHVRPLRAKLVGFPGIPSEKYQRT